MSASVSQIDYWRKGLSSVKTDGVNATEGGPGATFLSYNVFLGLSVLGGFLALDHLYLRSPLTFVAKIFVNVMFLGVWWVYDASQAVFNTDVVKVYGLGIPGLGPKGIGAGVLSNDVPDKKHMSFFIYCIALFFGGLIGIDSFIVGDKRSGYIRLLSLITGIFAFISIFWWIYNMFYFLFKTKDVMDTYPEFFGSPSPAKEGSGIIQYILSKIPFLGPILSTIQAQTVSPVLQPVAGVIQAGISTVDTAFSTVKEGIELGKTVVGTIGETAKAASSALSLAPAAAALSQCITTPAVKKVLSDMPQRGGGTLTTDNSILSYVFIGTLGLIAVAGFFRTYLRSNKNGNTPQNDSPPEPRVLRKSDQEKSTRST